MPVLPLRSSPTGGCAGTTGNTPNRPCGPATEQRGAGTDAGRERFPTLSESLNPPRDSEVNLTGNRHLERLFLDHTHHWLVLHGVLVFVLPFEQLNDCAGILSANFTRISAFRMEDGESGASGRLWSLVCAGMSGVHESQRRINAKYRCDQNPILPPHKSKTGHREQPDLPGSPKSPIPPKLSRLVYLTG